MLRTWELSIAKNQAPDLQLLPTGKPRRGGSPTPVPAVQRFESMSAHRLVSTVDVKEESLDAGSLERIGLLGTRRHMQTGTAGACARALCAQASPPQAGTLSCVRQVPAIRQASPHSSRAALARLPPSQPVSRCAAPPHRGVGVCAPGHGKARVAEAEDKDVGGRRRQTSPAATGRLQATKRSQTRGPQRTAVVARHGADASEEEDDKHLAEHLVSHFSAGAVSGGV